MGWTKDLALGEACQEELVQLLGCKDYTMSTGCFKEYDLIADGLKYEVKADRLTQKYGNLCIEYECNGKPSGISSTEADKWAYFVLDSDTEYTDCYLIPTEVIKAAIAEKKYHRVTSGGDGHRAQLYLFRRDLFKDYVMET